HHVRVRRALAREHRRRPGRRRARGGAEAHGHLRAARDGLAESVLLGISGRASSRSEIHDEIRRTSAKGRSVRHPELPSDELCRGRNMSDTIDLLSNYLLLEPEGAAVVLPGGRDFRSQLMSGSPTDPGIRRLMGSEQGRLLSALTTNA